MEFRDLENVTLAAEQRGAVLGRITLHPVDIRDIRDGLRGDAMWARGEPPVSTLPGIAAIVDGVPVYQDSSVTPGTIYWEES